MRHWVPRSLRGLLLAYEIAFLLLVIVTGALGGVWAYYWQQSSQESVRINTLLHAAEQIRGDLYLQLKEVTRARLLEDPQALRQYQDHLTHIGRQFEQLDTHVQGEGEALAADYMRQTYHSMREEMDKIFADPYRMSEAVRMKILDPLYEEWMLAEFESALTIFGEIVEKRQETLEASLREWTRLAPLLLPLPMLLALGLLLLSRRSLRAGFLRPLTTLTGGARQLSQGRLEHRIPEQGATEMVQLAQALNDMARELAASRDALATRERQAALGALVPVVAHNIRNPLASIRATAQILDETATPDELAETRAAIIDTVDRLERWVRSLLSYLHPLKPHRTLLSLASVADGALAPLAAKLREKNLTVVRHGWDNAPLLAVDADLLEQALYGLLHNAAEATPPGSTLSLSLSVSGPDAVLRLSDQGPGLPFDPQPHTLSPGPTTKRFGTGLGIPFAFKVCHAHGGTLRYERPASGGTVAVLSLPLERPEENE